MYSYIVYARWIWFLIYIYIYVWGRSGIICHRSTWVSFGKGRFEIFGPYLLILLWLDGFGRITIGWPLFFFSWIFVKILPLFSVSSVHLLILLHHVGTSICCFAIEIKSNHICLTCVLHVFIYGLFCLQLSMIINYPLLLFLSRTIYVS